MSREWYEYGDWRFEKARKEIERAFRKSRLTLPFDEVNQLSPAEASEAVEVLYRKLKKINRECFEDILEYVYYEGWLEAKPGTTPRKPPRRFLDQQLRAYNPVTKYVYDHEIERKQSRFFEAIVADAGSGNPSSSPTPPRPGGPSKPNAPRRPGGSSRPGSRRAVEKDFKTAQKNWEQMTRQYCLDIEDATAEQAYKDAGIWRVMWMTELDDRVCKVCEERHGRRYAIGAVPPKPHWNCRCWLLPLGRS